ncbi:MAG: hypothetical protein JRM86_02155 [Nitrososphaerota archaeon]|nr:hypothetical protein [Nitrososphaerota archaeon]MDG6966605.1 hypothetical protein [Nitrososphaerota archaeon]MDG6978536.1 hypothetical protein [Nitrososphaerota archaeon]MDG7005718.1 hypothetical protein [Nitrososphaerota archaeon]MDG7021082.1 hypothetical protein [Nitrososphaerota archaeon]
MNWETASYVANAVLAIGVIPTLFLAWRAIISAARNARFEHYVSRYQEVVTHLPYGVFWKGSENLDINEEQKRWLVACIDLCSEELSDYLRG